MIRTLIISLLISIFLGSGISQRTIFGTIQDSQSQAPIQFAHIFFLSDQSRGSISNQVGNFSIRIFETDEQDTLVISQMGYQTQFLPIANIQGEQLFINLLKDAFLLNEITVISDEGLRNILRKAFKKIPQNYGSKKYRLKAYYNEYAISDSSYSETIEAFVNIEDGIYTDPEKASKIFVKEFRRSNDNRNLPPHLKRSTTNSIYNLYEWFNPTRSRIFHLFAYRPEFFLKDCKFSNQGEYLQNRDTILKIHFYLPVFAKEVVGSKQYDFQKGEILIRKSDLGILKFRSGSKEEGSLKEVTYQKINGKYYPKTIQSILSFRFNNRQKSHFDARRLHIYQVIDQKTKEKKGKKLSRTLNLRKFRHKYNSVFWDTTQIMLQAKAPQALKADLNKFGNLSDQYYQNARNKRSIWQEKAKKQ